MMKTLADVPVGKRVEVVKYEDETNYEFKFISLGVLPGDIIEVKSRGFLGGPLSIKHGDAHFFALRKKYAQKILVKEIL